MQTFVEKQIQEELQLKKGFDKLERYESLGVNHHIGGTRMGDNLKTSVVDKNLKLHNNENLYVLGSSNFVSGGYANPNPIL